MRGRRVDLDRLKKRLERVEGKRNRVYKDTKGFLTIGIGHNLDARGISDKAISVILDDDIERFVSTLDENAPWWRNLDDVRQEVMLELVFNMGWGNGSSGLSSFKNTLPAIQSGNYEKAAQGLRLSKWARDVKEFRARTLIKALREGQWPEEAF